MPFGRVESIGESVGWSRRTVVTVVSVDDEAGTDYPFLVETMELEFATQKLTDRAVRTLKVGDIISYEQTWHDGGGNGYGSVVDFSVPSLSKRTLRAEVDALKQQVALLTEYIDMQTKLNNSKNKNLGGTE